MKIGHDKKSKGDGDDAEDFDMIIRTDSMGEILGDLFIKENASSASGEDE